MTTSCTGASTSWWPRSTGWSGRTSGRRCPTPSGSGWSELGVQLDRYWDLLRQRDARRRAGLDPDGAQERSADVVEGYRQ